MSAIMKPLDSALVEFKHYLIANNSTSAVVASYQSYIRQAFKECLGTCDTSAIEVNIETIDKVREYINADKQSKKLANTRSAMNKFEEFLNMSGKGGKNIAAEPVVVKISREAFKTYMETIYKKDDGKALTTKTINDYASKVTRIAKSNIYDLWHEVEPLNEALDRILDDEPFNAVDHGGCRAALPIFISCIEDIIAGKFKSTGVEVCVLSPR